MKKRLLELLSCPVCQRGDLILSVDSQNGDDILAGALECSNCKKMFSVINGIPRFVDGIISNYDRQIRDKFEMQWSKWGSEEVIFGRTKNESTDYFNEYSGTGFSQGELAGKIVLDAGCGHGRFTEIMAEGGAKISVGVDLGSGIDIAKKRTQHLDNVELIQADILKLPFKKEIFDYIWCDGVLIATKNTKEAFAELSKYVARSGGYRVWGYPVESLWWETLQRFLRFFTTRMPSWMLMPLCYAAVPLLSIVPTYSGTQWPKNRWNNVAQVIWDWYSPKYQWHHTPEEVIQWFKELNFTELESHKLKTSVFGIKHH